MTTTSGEPYPWVRRERESHPAYEAFRAYMTARSTRKVASQLAKSDTLIKRWCTEHDWVERVSAYDTFMMEQQTDGAVEWIVSARSETQKLTDKFRSLVNDRIDDCIRKREEPTIRLTQSIMALIRMQEHAAVVTDKTDEKLDRVTALLERLEQEHSHEPQSP